MSVNEFTTTTTANVHVTEWHLTARAWLGWMMALHGVSVGVVSSYSGRLNCYAAAGAAAVCVWSHCLLHTLPCLHEGLLAYEWFMPCWLWLLKCGSVAWPAYKPTPKALSLKFSQKLSAYMRVYMVDQRNGGSPFVIYWQSNFHCTSSINNSTFAASVSFYLRRCKL